MRLRIGQTNDVANDQRPSRNLINRHDLQPRAPGPPTEQPSPSVLGGRRSMLRKYPSIGALRVSRGDHTDRSLSRSVLFRVTPFYRAFERAGIAYGFDRRYAPLARGSR
jgi:hypothetical protein